MSCDRTISSRRVLVRHASLSLVASDCSPTLIVSDGGRDSQLWDCTIPQDRRFCGNPQIVITVSVRPLFWVNMTRRVRNGALFRFRLHDCAFERSELATTCSVRRLNPKSPDAGQRIAELSWKQFRREVAQFARIQTLLSLFCRAFRLISCVFDYGSRPLARSPGGRSVQNQG